MSVRHFYDVIDISRKLLVVEQIRCHLPESWDSAQYSGAYRLFLSATVQDL